MSGVAVCTWSPDLISIVDWGSASAWRICAAKRGSSPAKVLVCDDSEDHHDGKGFVVGLQGGSAKFRDKVDDWEIDISTVVQVGEGSVIPELVCLRTD